MIRLGRCFEILISISFINGNIISYCVRLMEILIDTSLCNATGLCMDICPEVFGVNEMEASEIRISPIPCQFHAKCREAAEKCPCGAIAVKE